MHRTSVAPSHALIFPGGFGDALEVKLPEHVQPAQGASKECAVDPK